MTTGKPIALTTWTFVGKVMFLLFKMLSRFVIAFLPRRKHLLTSGRCRQHEEEGECKNGFRWPPSPWVVLQLAPRCEGRSLVSTSISFVLLGFNLVSSFGAYVSISSFCIICCFYSYVFGRLVTFPDLGEVALCRKYPTGCGSALPSGHWNYMV